MSALAYPEDWTPPPGVRLRPEVKEQWLTDLRSGRFPQGRRRLNRRGQFCCLGVLCERAAQEGAVGREDRGVEADEAEREIPYAVYDGEAVTLPRPVRRWAFAEGIPLSDHHGVVGFLIEANDDRGWPFERIADWVEKHL